MKVDIWLSYGEKKWWINNPHALALRGNCFDDFLKILFEYGYDSYFCQVLIQKSRLPLVIPQYFLLPSYNGCSTIHTHSIYVPLYIQRGICSKVIE